MAVMLPWVRAISVIFIVLGVFSIIVGSLTLYYASPYFEYPVTTGVCIWGGALVLVSGILGIVSSFLEINNKKFWQLYTAHYVLSCVSISASIQMIVYNTFTLLPCRQVPIGRPFCLMNLNQMIIVAILGFVTGSIICLLTALNIPLYLMFRKRNLQSCGVKG